MSGEQDGDAEDLGSVAEEAVKLLGALSGWAKDATHDLDQHLATGSAECTVCPICRTVHVVRGLSPEVKTQLATAATSLLNAAAGLLATAVPDQADPASRAGVEHIDLDDDDASWPHEPPAPEEDPR